MQKFAIQRMDKNKCILEEMRDKCEKRNRIRLFMACTIRFGGIGLELVLAFGIEPLLYGGTQMVDWGTWQNILHWILTCIVWGTVGVILVKHVKKPMVLIF